MKKTVIGIGLLMIAGLVVAGIGIPHKLTGTQTVVNADRDTFQSAAQTLAGTVTGEGPYQTDAVVAWAIVPNAVSTDGGEGLVDTATLYCYARIAGFWTKTGDTARGFPPCTLVTIQDDQILKYADAIRLDAVVADSCGSGTNDTTVWTITYGWKQATTRKAGGE